MAKKKGNPNHFMGKLTGYSLIDEVYHIAPAYTKRFDDLAAQKAGVDEMLGSVTKHATETLTLLTRLRQQLWNDVVDDLGLAEDVSWLYKRDGTISKKDPDNPT